MPFSSIKQLMRRAVEAICLLLRVDIIAKRLHRGRPIGKNPSWPENILSHHFEKYLYDMDLKLTEHVRNTISLLYKQKSRVKIRYLELFLAKKNQFWPRGPIYFAENLHFQVGHLLLRHCDVIRWPIFMILVSMEWGDHILYYGIKQL